MEEFVRQLVRLDAFETTVVQFVTEGKTRIRPRRKYFPNPSGRFLMKAKGQLEAYICNSEEVSMVPIEAS